jgi:hypothetical protein
VGNALGDGFALFVMLDVVGVVTELVEELVVVVVVVVPVEMLVEELAELVVVFVVAVWVWVMFPQLTFTVLMVIFVNFVKFALTT